MRVAEELKRARRKGYAIGAFNTANLEVTKAICRAAKAEEAFVLIQTTPSAIEYAGLKTLYDIVEDEIKNSQSRAAIHLDHALDWPIIRSAIEVGYKSVMFDGSKLSYDENTILTEKVVKFAHSYDVSVEAEVGLIGHEEGGRISGYSVLSRPEQVAEFVEATRVDAIAVSIGNEHGAPLGEKLNFHLLERISDLVEIPLVIHGASGLSFGEIREAIQLGVAKFNIDTNIKRVFAQTIEESSEEDYRKVLAEGMEEVERVVRKYIRLFCK